MKKKKKKTKIKKDKLSFPKQLFREEYFKCPIWFNKEPNFATVILPTVKKQFKQGLLSKDNAKLIDNEYGRNEMRKGFNIKKDSYVERVNVIPNVANKVDYFGKDPNPFISDKDKAVPQKSLGTEFNRILEQVKGVPTRQRFSESTANILGKKNNPFNFCYDYFCFKSDSGRATDG